MRAGVENEPWGRERALEEWAFGVWFVGVGRIFGGTNIFVTDKGRIPVFRSCECWSFQGLAGTGSGMAVASREAQPIPRYAEGDNRAKPFLRDRDPRFSEAGVSHHVPHFHAYFQGEAAVFSINPVGQMAGVMEHKQRRLVEAWAELHQEELLMDWALLHSGRAANPIEPLR